MKIFRLICNQYSTIPVRYFASQNAARTLTKLNKVEDFGEGKRHFLLLSVYVHGETLFGRTVVRAHEGSHVDLFDKVQAEMKARDLCIKPLGGGMMQINKDDIDIYGECKTFGKACPFRTREILKNSKIYGKYSISVKKG